jgi:hypothetical protein
MELARKSRIRTTKKERKKKRAVDWRCKTSV